MPIRETDSRKLTWLAALCAGLVLLYALAPVLMPFFLAGILAYVCQPMVLWLGRRRVPRSLGSCWWKP